MAKEYLRDVITEPEVMEAFKVFDKDGYGTVNINELRYVLT
jgi:Ca2+-binding EF-hand superfamily protein